MDDSKGYVFQVTVKFVVSKINNAGLGNRPCASLWTLRVGAVAKAYRSSSVQPLLYLAACRGQRFAVAGLKQWQIKAW